MSPVYNIEYDFDNELLLSELFNQKQNNYSDPKHGTADNWKIANEKLEIATAEMEHFCNVYSLPLGKPRYYILKENSVLLPHIDYNTTCSINHVLSDDPAPVSFPGIGDFKYKTAILNTTIKHGVMNLGKKDRYLYKISFFDISYEEVCECLKN